MPVSESAHTPESGVLHFAFPGLPQVGCAFQTAGADGGANISWSHGPLAQVRASRQRLLQALPGATRLVELTQVHGDAMLFEPHATDWLDGPTVLQEADGLACSLAESGPGLGLVIKTADCQPILLAHRGGAHIAAIHAGWRGNRCNFPATAVARFCERYHLEPADVFAVRGPSLGPSRAEFVNFDSEWGDAFRPWFEPQSRCMDLWSLTRHQLQTAGVPAGQIYGLDICTMNNTLFHSYRRDRQCGRQAAIIWIRG